MKTLLRIPTAIALVSLCALFGACSFVDAVLGPPIEASARPALPPSEPPLRVRIVQSFLDSERKLHVNVHVTPLIDLPGEEIAVSVVGLKEGHVRREQVKRLYDAYPVETVSRGTTVALTFVMDPSDLNEFQVRCSWGAEGREMASRATALPAEAAGEAQTGDDTTQPQSGGGAEKMPPPEVVAAALSLADLSTSVSEIPCEAAPCDRLLTIRGLLKNDGAAPVERATLAARLVWVNEGEDEPAVTTGPLLPDEEEIVLEGIGLQPGRARRLKITIDRPVPVVGGGAFVPQIRLLGGD